MAVAISRAEEAIDASTCVRAKVVLALWICSTNWWVVGALIYIYEYKKIYEKQDGEQWAKFGGQYAILSFPYTKKTLQSILKSFTPENDAT